MCIFIKRKSAGEARHYTPDPIACAIQRAWRNCPLVFARIFCGLRLDPDDGAGLSEECSVKGWQGGRGVWCAMEMSLYGPNSAADATSELPPWFDRRY